MSVKVEGLDHVNIRTPDVAGTSRFFAEVLSMEVRPSPGSTDITKAAWIYDEAGRAIVHLGDLDIGYDWEAEELPQGLGSGRVHHVALRCAGYGQMCARLTEQGREFNVNHVPEARLRQVFITDPNGITLELNFFDY